jgi:hypothetical protein
MRIWLIQLLQSVEFEKLVQSWLEYPPHGNVEQLVWTVVEREMTRLVLSYAVQMVVTYIPGVIAERKRG